MVCEIVRLHVRKIIISTVNKIKVATCSKLLERYFNRGTYVVILWIWTRKKNEISGASVILQKHYTSEVRFLAMG